MLNNTVPIQIHFPVIDAAARIFFPRLFDFCQEAMEKVFSSNYHKEDDLGSMLDWIYQKKEFPVVVHCESDYIDPIVLSEELLVKVTCSHIGNSSFHLQYHFTNATTAKLKATAKTVHVFTAGGTEKMKLPANWKVFLQKLS